MRKRLGILAIIGPGLLVAATGVGAGDLATASFTGSELGVAILWAVLLGAGLKFILTEGLARWQLATGETALEGVITRFGAWVGWVFLAYLLLWSFFVGSALMSACGVTLQALFPLFEDPSRGKIVFGILSSLAGLALVLRGGFSLFEKVMGVSIAAMFAIVLFTAARLWPGTGPVLEGLFVPSIPDFDGGGLTWTVALLGGVGGTVTILCYGYWIREKGREASDLRLCRIDLAVGYAVTALFGIAMVIIGSTLELSGSGSGLLVALSEKLAGPLGTAGKYAFLVGALGAVFSSLLGVWQAVPYLFADCWNLCTRGLRGAIDTEARPYRLYLLALALVPMAGLLIDFKEVQKIFAVVGAAFIPMLGLAILILNGRKRWIGEELRSRWTTSAALASTVLVFAWIAVDRVLQAVGW